MAITYTDPAANAMLSGSGLNAYIGAAALFQLYAGTIPANANAALGSPTLLVSITLASPLAFNAASGAQMTMILVPSVSVSVTGAPAFFRIYQSGGVTAVLQGTAGPSGGGTYDLPLPLNLSNPQVTANQAFQIGTLTLGF